jgi:hypothetical protein
MVTKILPRRRIDPNPPNRYLKTRESESLGSFDGIFFPSPFAFFALAPSKDQGLKKWDIDSEVHR